MAFDVNVDVRVAYAEHAVLLRDTLSCRTVLHHDTALAYAYFSPSAERLEP